MRYRLNTDDAQWVENVDDDAGATHYVFGRLQQRTLAMTLRAELHAVAQPVVPELH